MWEVSAIIGTHKSRCQVDVVASQRVSPLDNLSKGGPTSHDLVRPIKAAVGYCEAGLMVLGSGRGEVPFGFEGSQDFTSNAVAPRTSADRVRPLDT